MRIMVHELDYSFNDSAEDDSFYPDTDLGESVASHHHLNQRTPIFSGSGIRIVARRGEFDIRDLISNRRAQEVFPEKQEPETSPERAPA